MLMFVHPRCPCSTASLAELAAIVERNQKRVATEVVFVKPHGAGQGWERTPLWDQAANIPGLRVVVDEGALAGQFGAQTSGYVVLYDANGRLLFNGGITRSRGHEGESAGRRAICTLLSAETPAERQTPVFGCPLFSPGNCDETNCARVVQRNGNRR